MTEMKMPRHVPPELARTLGEALRDDPAVAAAWLVRAGDPTFNGGSQLTVAVLVKPRLADDLADPPSLSRVYELIVSALAEIDDSLCGTVCFIRKRASLGDARRNGVLLHRADSLADWFLNRRRRYDA